MPKPKLKLNTQQAEALFQLYNDIILHETPLFVIDKLVHLHMRNIYNKLRHKMESRFYINSWHLSLEPYEAMAWHEYWQNRSLPPEYVYEASFINQQVNELNKLYA